MRMERERAQTWDLQQLAAVLQHVELYEASLETGEFPSALLEAFDEFQLAPPHTKRFDLQEFVDILLQMISFPDRPELSSMPHSTLSTLQSARDWAVETLWGLDTARTEFLQPQELSTSLMQMQTKLFVAAPCRDTDIQMEMQQSLIAAVQSEEGDSLSGVLDLCAMSVDNDEECLQFVEAALSGRTEELVFGRGFLHRLFDRRPTSFQAEGHSKQRKKRRLLDSLTPSNQISVWSNHLPSWRSQVQTWILKANRDPFQPINMMLPDGWWPELDESSQLDAVTPCRQYSYLYVALIEVCQCHVDLLGSCRTMEVISALSRSTRQGEDAKLLFNRQLLRQVSLDVVGCPPTQRERMFIGLDTTLTQLQAVRSNSDLVWQYEWIGVLEHPHLLHEALETVFPVYRSKINEHGDFTQQTTLSAARFFSWFYSFTSSLSADDISAVLTQTASELTVTDLHSGAEWLRRNRAEFSVEPAIRVRLVWFWLLKSIATVFQTPKSMPQGEMMAVTTNVLESVEYIFRRFTPPRAKMSFQVELVSQLLVELEWRAHIASKAHAETMDIFLDRIAPLCSWLTKIVRLMQLEEQTAQQEDTQRRRYVVNHVQQLTKRLNQFLC